METQHTKHVTDKLASHFVWCRNYRKRILIGKMATSVEKELRRICEANSWTRGTLNIQEDQVHLVLSAPPAIAPAQIVPPFKGTAGCLVFQRFPEVKKQL